MPRLMSNCSRPVVGAAAAVARSKVERAFCISAATATSLITARFTTIMVRIYRKTRSRDGRVTGCFLTLREGIHHRHIPVFLTGVQIFRIQYSTARCVRCRNDLGVPVRDLIQLLKA